MESRVSLGNVTQNNITQLKKLNSVLFPVRYATKYYSDALAAGNFTQLAYYDDICIGVIACRLEKNDGLVHVYIMTLGVLAPYRRLGIGSKLLNHCLDLCTQDTSIFGSYLHVQTNNNEAVLFYKKFGFEITGTIKNYYRNIDPPDCFVLAKTLNSQPTNPKCAP